MREIARTRLGYVLCKALTGKLACNDKDIGKPNGSESRIYLRCAASKPHSTFDSLLGLSKMLMWLCEADRLRSQPKMWAHLFKNPHYIFSKSSHEFYSKMSNSLWRF